jgi:hypothetical protein
MDLPISFLRPVKKFKLEMVQGSKITRKISDTLLFIHKQQFLPSLHHIPPFVD